MQYDAIYSPNRSYVILRVTARKHSKGALVDSMVPIPCAIIGLHEGAGVCQGDEVKRVGTHQRECRRPCPMRVRAAVRFVCFERAAARTGSVRAGYRTAA
jgi:hypothetical protein